MTNPLLDHFQILASYNTLANRKLYEACSRLSNAEYRKRREAFFGSIMGTLNHLMAGDRIWLARFGGEEVPSTDLDATLYEDFMELWRVREAEDARIEGLVSGVDGKFLQGSIRYVNNEGRTLDDPVSLLVAHFFNHQTHHRGQVHDMLSQTEVAPPVLDLHRILRP
jgi:uncharacterized damage-inducible protein DinB